jgi:hypothetical protein
MALNNAAIQYHRYMARLPEELRNILCRWLTLGIVDDEGGLVKSAYVTLDGSVLVIGDEIVGRLEESGVGLRLGDGLYLQEFFNWTPWVRELCGEVVTEETEPMGMRLLGFSPFTYAEYGDVMSGYVELIKIYGKYVSGVFNEAIFRLWGLSGVRFDEQVDLVIVTGDELIAHHFLDIRRTEHRGFTTSARYLQYGFDRSILMHPFISDDVNKEVAKAMLNRGDVKPVGYFTIKYDESEILGIIIYKWPHINPLPLVSRTVAERNTLIKEYLRHR